MKLLIVSDIHGNYHALRAVIQAVAHDRMLCCGDLVVGCPFPQQCIDAVKDGGGPVCTGNHDDAVAHGRNVSDYLPEQLAHFGPVLDRAAALTRGQISDSARTFLKQLPRHCHFELDGVSFYMNHTAPGMSLFDYLDGDMACGDLEKIYRQVTADVVVTGHTHLPYIKECGSRIFINPGSVGEPRDGDPRAGFATFDTDTGQIALGRVAYDTTETLRWMEKLALPDYARLSLVHGLPPNPHEAGRPHAPDSPKQRGIV